MSRRRLRSASAVLRPVAGLALIPTAAAMLLAAARAFGDLSAHTSATAWFLGGFGGYAAAYALGVLRLKPLYVLAHELTHAMAVWMGGGKVFKLVVRAEKGHVDLSHMNAFIALAPYWIPLYALALVATYRLVLWAGPPPGAREAFLLLMGAALAFHLVHTARSLWVAHQSDLDHAGIALSIALIALLNGAVLLAALKCLFPEAVSLASSLNWVAAVTAGFWRQTAGLLRRGGAAFSAAVG
ncbi:MAG: hypothetical protein ABII00_10520 [Elusimicrobiota bacterium]